MNDNLLRFPVPDRVEKKITLIEDLRPAPVITVFNREDSRALLGVAQRVWRGVESLTDLLDSDRDLAKHVGIETLSIELIAERLRIERILDDLEYAEKEKANAEVSVDGLELLRRAEKLLTEAFRNIAKYGEKKSPTMGDAGSSSSMSTSASSSSSIDSVLIGTIVFFSFVVVVSVVAAVATKK